MASALIRQCVGFRFFSISSVSSFFASALIQKLYLFHVRKSTSVWGCARRLVGQVSGSGWFVGWSVGKCTCLTTHTAQVLASMFLHVLSFFIFFFWWMYVLCTFYDQRADNSVYHIYFHISHLKVCIFWMTYDTPIPQILITHTPLLHISHFNIHINKSPLLQF